MPDTNVSERPPTRAELLRDRSTLMQGIDAIKAQHGEDINAYPPDAAADFEAFVGGVEEIDDAVKALPDPDALRRRVDAVKANTGGIRRPNLAGHVETVTPGTGGEVKTITTHQTESEDEKFLTRGPWKSFGHFCYAVRQGGAQPGLSNVGTLGEWNGRVAKIDSAVKGWSNEVKAASGMSEFTDPDGSAFVPVEFSQMVWQRPQAELTNLMSMCDVTPVSGNTMVLRAWQDKARTSFTMYGGATAYWRAEAAQMTASRPKTRDITLRLQELYTFFYATDELLQDAPALSAELTKIASLCLTAKMNDAIINGDGVGKPLGIMASPCLITTTSTAGGANTITAADIDAMWVRRSPNFNGVWLYNLDCEPQFARLNYAATATNTTYNAAWVYIPAGGLSGKPYDSLKGRQMIETEYCQALGTTGDIILSDLSQYKVITKTSGIQNAVSMHLRFDYGETAFRWMFRADGRPMWDAALTPARGSTRSPFVVLPSTRT